MGTLKNLYEIIKELKNLTKQYHDQAMAEKVIEIQEGFFEFREEMEKLRDENRQLKEKNKELELSVVDEADLELTARGYYIKKSEKEQEMFMGYCPACWNNHRKLMPLVSIGGMTMRCCNCQNGYRR